MGRRQDPRHTGRGRSLVVPVLALTALGCKAPATARAGRSLSLAASAVMLDGAARLLPCISSPWLTVMRPRGLRAVSVAGGLGVRLSEPGVPGCPSVRAGPWRPLQQVGQLLRLSCLCSFLCEGMVFISLRAVDSTYFIRLRLLF